MPDPITAITTAVSVGGSMMESDAQSEAASSAAGAQTEASRLQVQESRRQFDEIRKLLEPFVAPGTQAIGQQGALLGLSGAGAQQSAISALENSPQMRALTQSGENAILQNASATGGLRGGNIQAALGQFRPQLLSSLIENQFNKLGSLSSIGQNAAAGVGNAGMQSTNAINQALGTIGQAQAGAALAQGRAQSGMIGGLSQGIGGLLSQVNFGGTTTIPTQALDAYNSIGNIRF